MKRKRPVELMDLPKEVLSMIVKDAETPLDDSTPLDQNNYGGVKALSQVNRTFRAICLQTSLKHVRIWNSEDSLARRLREIYDHGQHILSNSTSISIRSIGYTLDAARHYRTRAPEKTDFIRDFGLVLSAMPKLREVRLVSENGRHGIEPVLRKFFNAKKLVFPEVKSLYIRTAGPVARIYRCFPNLEAINFNLHGNTGKVPSSPLSQDFKILKEPIFQSLRTLAIYKSAGSGWTGDDISAVVKNFPNVERLFLQGCLGGDVSHMFRFLPHKTGELFAPHRNLRYLALTDEPYLHITKNHRLVRKLEPFIPYARWEAVAKKFFAVLPDLVELCMIRQTDFSGLVLRPIRHAVPDADDGGPRGVPVEVVRRYADESPRRRLNFPPARWNGDMCVWWPAWGPVPTEDDFGMPDEPDGAVQLIGRHNGVHFRNVAEGLPVVLYTEMILDHCETGPWDVEWLRVIRNQR
ncbi:hypothetical protein MYCTH_2112920 [Thermothelomyces thermophilus ATCC 42464]|uniref:Uncharacterized protein n=1 Tax=Thermothelomyces thermophilus (strain ATCC 42464 / BCRC 31852 / DSM 1799) TaxID=573729 RepID=G2QLU2_THET4|nr:uncharacterized protein MYCTH_2112920 [Thermothelomyces thermophilus ATCC 42464]AEO60922.1 hypothetical protein MYCTH_2112920 [Thermothelomyces thermophilus ATCC 42464]